MRLARVVILAAVIAAAAAGAQPLKPPAPTPTPLELLTRVQARYQAGPTCERMRVEVRADSGRVSRSWLVFRVIPAPKSDGSSADASREPAPPSPPGATGPRFGLELGALKLSLDSRTLTAIHERNPQTCFQAQVPGDGPLTTTRLLEILPPVPLPQLDVIQSTDLEHLAVLTPYARAVHWKEAVSDPRVPSRFKVTGESDRGAVSMTIRGDQIQVVDLRDDGRGATIRIELSPILPCRAEDAAVDAAGRTHVEQLSDLQPRSGVLRTGAGVPEMQLSTVAGQVQRLKELYTPPARFLPAPEAERLVLVFVRYGRDPLGGAPALGRVEASELARALASMQRDAYGATPRPRVPGARPGEAGAGQGGVGGGGGGEPELPLVPTFNYAQVMVLDAPPPAADVLLSLIRREQRSWGGGDDGAAGSDHLAWTTDAKSSVDLFATAGEPVAVVLDAQQRLRAVLPISARTSTEELVDQITAVLMEAGE